jgi:nitrite transporter
LETTVEAFAAAADKKGALLRRSRAQYFIASALAGAYIGFGVALIFAIGAPLSAAHSPFLKVVMGASFGVALALVIFAGAELFTGNALVLTLGVLSGRVSLKTLASVWGWSYLGNLVGSVFLAWLIAQSGALGDETPRSFIEIVAAGKMQMTFGVAFARGILANWLVCLAVWSATRTTNDVAKLIMIFWCLFAFVGAGFEHSIANMTLLSLALFQPHGELVSWAGFAQNLIPVTLGNIVGGGVFVGGLYWLTSPIAAWRREHLAVVSNDAVARQPIAVPQPTSLM